jgi:hypothetical protein
MPGSPQCNNAFPGIIRYRSRRIAAWCMRPAAWPTAGRVQALLFENG